MYTFFREAHLVGGGYRARSLRRNRPAGSVDRNGTPSEWNKPFSLASFAGAAGTQHAETFPLPLVVLSTRSVGPSPFPPFSRPAVRPSSMPTYCGNNPGRDRSVCRSASCQHKFFARKLRNSRRRRRRRRRRLLLHCIGGTNDIGAINRSSGLISLVEENIHASSLMRLLLNLISSLGSC